MAKNPRYPVYSCEAKIPVPCGKCPPCQARRASNWGFRLRKEDEVSQSAYFVTLTYNTDHVPISARGYLTLKKEDVQKFLKRLRKLEAKHGNGRRIRYYCAGEYGSTNFRPHYHIILFDISIQGNILTAWNIEGKEIGEIHIGSVSGASIGYTLKYINKGKIIPMHPNDDRAPEFSLMSKKMGLSYLTPETIQYHQEDLNRNYVTIEDGQKLSMPRYYRNKIYTKQQQDVQAENTANRALLLEHEARYEYYLINGTELGFEEVSYQRAIQKLKKHRENGLNNRKL